MKVAVPLISVLVVAVFVACGPSEPSTLDVLRAALTPDPEVEQIERTVGPRDFDWIAHRDEAPHLYREVPCPNDIDDPRGLRNLPEAGCMQGRLVNTLPFTLERVRVICQNQWGIKSDLIFAHDPASGEATEWVWVNVPISADFACGIDWRVSPDVMRE